MGWDVYAVVRLNMVSGKQRYINFIDIPEDGTMKTVVDAISAMIDDGGTFAYEKDSAVCLRHVESFKVLRLVKNV